MSFTGVPDRFAVVLDAEASCFRCPRAAVALSRCLAEKLVEELRRKYKLPPQDDFRLLISSLRAHEPALMDDLHEIRKLGNRIHGNEAEPTPGEAVTALSRCHRVLRIYLKRQGIELPKFTPPSPLKKSKTEIELIKHATKEALAAKKASGVRLGAAPYEGPAIPRIIELRQEGWSVRDIAEILNSEGFSSKRGGKWSHTTVHRIVKSAV